MADFVRYEYGDNRPQIGNDEWGREVMAKIREGLRSRNMVDLGKLRVWKIVHTHTDEDTQEEVLLAKVAVTNADNLYPFEIPCKSEAEAAWKASTIALQIQQGFMSLKDILGTDDIPPELL